MHRLVGSFDRLQWDRPQPGVREKKIVIGSKIIRLLELTEELEHPDWCDKGHAGYVLEGAFTLDINGSENILYKGDLFVVDDDNRDERHIPKVGKRGRVLLLLIEEA